MSYDIALVDRESRLICEVPEHHLLGGTYQLGGSTFATLNITWNYSRFYYCVFGEKGIRTLYGMTGAESIPVLDNAISQLGTDVHEDYWFSTEGNARKALQDLRELALMCPDGVWEGD